MKKFLACTLAISILTGCLFGCSTSTESSSTTSTASTTTTTTASTEAATTEAVAELSYDELVEAAKAEGTVVLYGANSYLQDAADLFTEEFGIKVEFTQLGETEMIEKVTSECAANAVYADVVCAQDTYRVQAELINTGYATEWTNSRVGEIVGDDDCTALIWYYDTKSFMYGSDLVGDDWAVNLWRITDPDYKGLFTMKDPTSEGVNFDMLTMLTSDDYAALLADAYVEYYGTELVLTTENAGWEFIKMLFNNDVLLTTSDTTSATTVGALDQSDTWIGYFSSQRYSTQESKGIKLSYDITNSTPFVGYSYPVYAIIPEGCSHPNAAKLFSEWLLSENGWEGFSTYYGGFSANPDNVYATPYSYDEVKSYLIVDDADYLVQTRADVEDFVESLR